MCCCWRTDCGCIKSTSGYCLACHMWMETAESELSKTRNAEWLQNQIKQQSIITIPLMKRCRDRRRGKTKKLKGDVVTLTFYCGACSCDQSDLPLESVLWFFTVRNTPQRRAHFPQENQMAANGSEWQKVARFVTGVAHIKFLADNGFLKMRRGF